MEKSRSSATRPISNYLGGTSINSCYMLSERTNKIGLEPDEKDIEGSGNAVALRSQRANMLTQLAPWDAGDCLRHHDETRAVNLEHWIEVAEGFWRHLCRQERDNDPRRQFREQIGLNVEYVTRSASGHRVHIEPCHQNCRYAAKGKPCDSTCSFHA
ncbi:hypothetical protein Acry_2230 [Acidiphilium cryptum JF-5]|uniref:Uncharacterized protein n=1 Tax=Acidiphilium cryptum (strain JF-5) TaxID=349163 RepID=A5G0P4_ACICJ|nr:hypothetical protein Acry_2230 [Acidiphilium cryptum JF-5]